MFRFTEVSSRRMMPPGPTPFQMAQGDMSMKMMLDQFMQGFIQYAEQQKQNQQQYQQYQQQQLRTNSSRPSRATPKQRRSSNGDRRMRSRGTSALWTSRE